MSIFKSIWFMLNISLIFLILLRSPDEQSLQERISPLNIFESSGGAERSIDSLINFLIICYFIFGYFWTS